MENLINQSKKRILVTGGYGFLGGRIATHLHSQNYEVVIATRREVKPAEMANGYDIIHVSWENSETLEQACKGIDYIVHTSGINAQDSEADPELALRINALATAALVKAAVKSRVEKIVYFSTAHVYQNPLNGIIDEEVLTRNLHPYATSHRAGEDVILAAGAQKLIKTIVLRLSNAYGTPSSPETNCWKLLVNDLCKQAVETGILTLNSNGLQQRDFISISAVVSAVCDLFRNDQVSGLYNLGSGKSSSVLDMARLVQNRAHIVLGSVPKIKISETVKSYSISIPLEYRIDKLLATGLIIKDKQVEEVDNLLIFCRKMFYIE